LQLRDVSVVSDVKKVFDMISRLENISDTDFEEAFRELKEDDGDESDPKPFEVFARVLAKKGSLIPELKKELNEMSENFKESFDLNKKMTPEASVRLALRRAFKEFPELEFIFSDPEQLDIEFERYANGDNLKKGNFLD